MPFVFQPFRGWRFDEQIAGPSGTLIAPPYDVLSDDDRRAFGNRSDYNIVHLDARPRQAGEDPYRTAAKLLSEWVAKGILKQDDAPAYTLLRQEYAVEGGSHVRWGLIGLAGVVPFSAGIVLPHEKTHAGPKEDRFNLMKATRATFSQIFGLYSDPEGVTASIAAEIMATPPQSSFTDRDGVVHKAWLITDPASQRRIASFLADRHIFIADGHHRYETGLAFRDWAAERGEATAAYDGIMMYLVDMDQPDLVILPYHRLVRGVTPPDDGGWPEAVEVEKLSWDGTVESLSRLVFDLPDTPPTILFFGGRRGLWKVRFTTGVGVDEAVPAGEPKALANLPVTHLHRRLLPKVMPGAGKEDLTTTPFVEEVVEAVAKGWFHGAFLLPPTPLSAIREVSLAGGVMPQKSTYFYPKIPTGLVNYRFDAP